MSDWPPKDRSDSALHRNGVVADTGPLVVSIEVSDITGAAMREDRGAVAVKFTCASGDRLLLGMSPGMVDALTETLRKIREEMDAAGVERSIPFGPINTMQIGTHPVEGVAFVAMIIDRSLPSAAAYLMPPKAARTVAKQLTTAARLASSARGELIAPDPEDACPGHVASLDNPKVCARCGVNIESLRPPED